jgi:hypothetical protein
MANQVDGVIMYAGRSRIKIDIIEGGGGALEVTVEDHTAGLNTRTARVRLSVERLHAIGAVLLRAGDDRKKIEEAMRAAFRRCGGGLNSSQKKD